MTKMRLDRLLGNYGYIDSRSQARDFVRSNEVLHQGKPVTDVTTGVLPRDVTINGCVPGPDPGFIIMMHKPVGYECSHAGSGRMVYDLLPAQLMRRSPRVVTVGRLDKDTSGLLLLTDDGQVVQRLNSPRHHVAKTYEAVLRRPLGGGERALFASGELLLGGEDKPLLPAVLTPMEDGNKAQLTITEGRYHQVKRMFEATGNEVVALHRLSVGGLTLDELPPGEWRYLTPGDRIQLFN